MEDPKTAIVTPPACDGRISGTSGVVFSPLCGLQPPGYVEALGYLYTLPVPHKAAYRCSADHKIIPTDQETRDPGEASRHTRHCFKHVTYKIALIIL